MLIEGIKTKEVRLYEKKIKCIFHLGQGWNVTVMQPIKYQPAFITTRR